MAILKTLTINGTVYTLTPTVSSDDEGAFLRVSNGEWTTVKLTDVSVEGA